ncbi:histone-lysine N-methyltransferase, H3 lysine-9 specific SUVH5-like [Mercurialis annua]|uniref:histone-lysine N-methyltransferase, H3 lysine-9 specific SUVH5-like n=1 Tax=Mercurialis annua TaxID=3986 RepID=UPI00215F2618|nr:histone-lysine N-methyltransferase, H3 lysine-9 specific SUVH5-like [Mercurialis annua]
MVHSWSKVKRDRPDETRRHFYRGCGGSGQNIVEGNDNVNHFRNPNPEATTYNQRKNGKEILPNQGFINPHSMKRNSCSVFKNRVSADRKFFEDKKRPLAHNVRHYANWSDAVSSTSKEKVKEALRLFDETLKKFEDDAKAKGRSFNIYLHQDAVTDFGKHRCVNTIKRVGSVPGVEVNDRFQYRAQLYVIGLHLQLQKGIDYLKDENGVLLATSIVVGDKYSNEMKSSDVLIYCGHGGNPKVQNQGPLRDQVLEQGNLALKNSMEFKRPVRVILTESKSSKACVLAGRKKTTLGSSYVYDGLYLVEKMKQERGEFGKLVFIFELRRMPGQAERTNTFVGKSKNCRSNKDSRIVNDISEGKEKIPIPVVNSVDDERPSEFTYIAQIAEHDQPRLSGCDCGGKCCSFEDCLCKSKNGEEIAYDASKRLIKKKPRIYECGHSCKCSDSCTNRVSQLGIQLQLEIFKTDSKGWGVRSRSYIRAGTFICEYVGRIVESNQAYKTFGSDEYMFDVGENYDDRVRNIQAVHEARHRYYEKSNFLKKECGITIDAGQYGNVGRFINHSCNSNLHVQNVFYDSVNPHVMLFAKRDIAPQTELTYDYNCRLAEVRYSNRSVKAKNCMCKSVNCVGKFC